MDWSCVALCAVCDVFGLRLCCVIEALEEPRGLTNLWAFLAGAQMPKS